MVAQRRDQNVDLGLGHNSFNRIASPPEQLINRRGLHGRQQLYHLIKAVRGHVHLDQYLATSLKHALQQRVDLTHGVRLVGISKRRRISDQLRIGSTQRVDYAQPRRLQRPTRLGDVDNQIDDVGNLRLPWPRN